MFYFVTQALQDPVSSSSFAARHKLRDLPTKFFLSSVGFIFQQTKDSALLQADQHFRGIFEWGMLYKAGYRAYHTVPKINPIYVFPEMQLCSLVPNFYIHVSVSH